MRTVLDDVRLSVGAIWEQRLGHRITRSSLPIKLKNIRDSRERRAEEAEIEKLCEKLERSLSAMKSAAEKI